VKPKVERLDEGFLERVQLRRAAEPFLDLEGLARSLGVALRGECTTPQRRRHTGPDTCPLCSLPMPRSTGALVCGRAHP
jgi:hypothetical protein